jgi:type I restriction enzyme S subunit
MGEPVLRFKDSNNSNYPDSIAVTLDTFCKFQQGVQVDLGLQVNTNTDGYLPFLRIENYTQKSSEFRYIPEHLSKNKIINKDEIAIVRYGATAGFIARGLSGVLANNLFKLIVDDSKISNDYLFHYLRTNRVFAFFQSEMAGGAMPALSFAIVKNLKLNIPSLSEQAKISDFLTALDDKITQLTQKHELLNQYKKGLMQQIFSQKLQFKVSNFKDWKTQIIADIAEVIVGGTPSTANYDYWNDGDVPWISSGELNNGIIKAPVKYITQLGLKKSSAKLMPKNTTVLAMTGATLGRIGLLGFEACGNQSVAGFILNENYNSKFLFYSFLYNINKVFTLAAGGAQKGINKGSIESLEFSFPSLKEQEKIADFLTAIDEKITSVQSQLELAKRYKQGLLQQMFV